MIVDDNCDYDDDGGDDDGGDDGGDDDDGDYEECCLLYVTLYVKMIKPLCIDSVSSIIDNRILLIFTFFNAIVIFSVVFVSTFP